MSTLEATIRHLKDLESLFSLGYFDFFQPETDGISSSDDLTNSLRGVFYKYTRKSFSRSSHNFSSSNSQIVTAYQLNSTFPDNSHVLVQTNDYFDTGSQNSLKTAQKGDFILISEDSSLDVFDQGSFQENFSELVPKVLSDSPPDLKTDFVSIFGANDLSYFESKDRKINLSVANKIVGTGFIYDWKIQFPDGGSVDLPNAEKIVLDFSNPDWIIGEIFGSYLIEVNARSTSGIHLNATDNFEVLKNPVVEISESNFNYFDDSLKIIELNSKFYGEPDPNYNWTLNKNGNSTNLLAGSSSENAFYQLTGDDEGTYEVSLSAGLAPAFGQAKKNFKIVNALIPEIEVTGSFPLRCDFLMSSFGSEGLQLTRSFLSKENFHWILSVCDSNLFVTAYIDLYRADLYEYYWSLEHAGNTIELPRFSDVSTKIDLKSLDGTYKINLTILNDDENITASTSVEVIISSIPGVDLRKLEIVDQQLSKNEIYFSPYEAEKFDWKIFKNKSDGNRELFANLESYSGIAEFNFENVGIFDVELNVTDSVGRARKVKSEQFSIFSPPNFVLNQIKPTVFDSAGENVIEAKISHLTYNESFNFDLKSRSWVNSVFSVDDEQISQAFGEFYFSGLIDVGTEKLFYNNEFFQFIISGSSSTSFNLFSFDAPNTKLLFGTDFNVLLEGKQVEEILLSELTSKKIVFVELKESPSRVFSVEIYYLSSESKISVSILSYYYKSDFTAAVHYEKLYSILPTESVKIEQNKAQFLDFLNKNTPKIKWKVWNETKQVAINFNELTPLEVSFNALLPDDFEPENDLFGKDIYNVSAYLSYEGGLCKNEKTENTSVWSEPKAILNNIRDVVENTSLILDGRKSFVPQVGLQKTIKDNTQEIWRRSLFHARDVHFAVNQGSLGYVPQLTTESVTNANYIWEIRNSEEEVGEFLSNKPFHEVNLDAGEYEISLIVQDVLGNVSEKNSLTITVHPESELDILISDCFADGSLLQRPEPFNSSESATTFGGEIPLGTTALLSASLNHALNIYDLSKSKWEIFSTSADSKKSLIHEAFGKEISFTFDDKNAYEILLSLKDNNGKLVQKTRKISTTFPDRIKAKISYRYESIDLQKFIILDGCASSGSENLTYDWKLFEKVSPTDFKSQTKFGQIASFPVSSNVDYTVQLSITDSSSNSSTESIDFKV